MTTSSFAADALPSLIDPQATAQTVALFHNLFVVGRDHVLFGHHDTLAYGHDWVGDPHRSDVKDVTGDFPSVYGWDLATLEQRDPSPEFRGSAPDENALLGYAREAFERGGVVTFCWHQSNPVSGKSAWDPTPALHSLLPGGGNHDYYLKTLDRFAEFFKKLSPMPVIFRPYHEHNGEWFWWGMGHGSEEDYIAVWRMTVTYLRDTKGVHNVIYAFSPDRSRIDLDDFGAHYMYGYPGDEYVDVFGLDDYKDVRLPREGEASLEVKKQRLAESLTKLAQLSEAHGKIPALTETGCETLNIPDWWTTVLLPALQANEDTRKIAWVEVWRNANLKREKVEHFFASYPGHSSAPDFIKFHDSPFVLFESELPDMYKEPVFPDEKTEK